MFEYIYCSMCKCLWQLMRMSNSNMLISFSFSLFFFFISFASATHKCSPQQTLDLLLFKESLSSINHSFDSYSYSPCQDWLGSDYYPMMMKWNKNTDCCKWDGVTCNHFTGDVIAIDLSCGMLHGTIHPNSTLFHLPHLQKLNLAYNDLGASQIPREIHRVSTSLMHINISGCWLMGEIPLEILYLPQLISLDLSWNSGLQMQPSVFQNLLRNSTHLRELLISEVQIGGVLPNYLNLTSSLKSLDLLYTGLQGKLPHNIFNLQYLEKLDLSHNYLRTGPWPKVNASVNVPLKWLDLSLNNLSQEIPNSIGHLKSLNYLDLSDCGLVGSLPKSLVNLRHLTTLDLTSNQLNGMLLSFLFTLPLLENIHLSHNMFSGGLPSELFKCRSLKSLSLWNNQFDGEINGGSTPLSFIQLVNLTHLDLRRNNFTGVWDLDRLLSNLPNLQSLHLSSSGLSVVFNNSSSYANPHLQELGLGSCNLTSFPPLICNLRSLKDLDISDNRFSGVIPQCLGNITSSLLFLVLSSNQFLGPFPPSICNMRSLLLLDLSNNRFSGVIPQCLGNIASSLRFLELSSNQFLGPFPPSICNMRSLLFLYLSNNRFSGVIPQCLGHITSSLQVLDIRSNQFQGMLPPSICKLRSLVHLDISNNSFSGVIPQCLGNISSSLMVLDMGTNHFHGSIPNVYGDCGGLEGLILNENQLQGEIPSSLSRCRSLKVLDLGNNQLNGTFPSWSKDLPLLRVLVLKSNKLHGPIETSFGIKSPFPSMQVLDISNNGFEGHLPGMYFQNFKAMKNVEKKSTTPEYLDIGLMYYSFTVVMKGVEQVFSKVFVGYTIVDLSNNRFDGEIPGVISSLTSLIVLNLSHNHLTGQIPNNIGNLLEIESLDLSCNQLTGKIPQSLAEITNLEVLNLSENNFVGRIPLGTQFSTFNASFEGNPKLCGIPLPKKCEHLHEPPLEDDEDEDADSGFTWRVVMMGYGCGTVIGLVMGHIMLPTGRPKWFIAIADAGERMIQTRQNRRIYAFIGK